MNQTKVCTKCWVEKSLEEFDSCGKYCKLCRKEYNKSYRNLNSEKIKATKAEWYAKNKVHVQAVNAEWKLKNRELTKKYSKKFRQSQDAGGRGISGKELHNIQSKKYRDLLHNAYVRQVIKSNTTLSSDDIPQELVDVTRVQLLIKRKVKEIQNGK